MAHENLTEAEVLDLLDKGMYAWPGGYPMYFVTSDGGALSFSTVKEEWECVQWSVSNDVDDGWRVVAVDVNWEDPNLYDDHTSERIESAYAD